MRKELGAAVRKLFERGMLSSPFSWRAHKPDGAWTIPGERIFLHEQSEHVHLWCALVPSSKDETFTVEVGWSLEGRFPRVTGRPSVHYEKDAYEKPEGFLRLGQLSHGKDHWWRVQPYPHSVPEIQASLEKIPGEEAERRSAKVVEAALLAVEQHGLPFLRRVVQQTVRGDKPASRVCPST